MDRAAGITSRAVRPTGRRVPWLAVAPRRRPGSTPSPEDATRRAQPPYLDFRGFRLIGRAQPPVWWLQQNSRRQTWWKSTRKRRVEKIPGQDYIVQRRSGLLN